MLPICPLLIIIVFSVVHRTFTVVSGILQKLNLKTQLDHLNFSHDILKYTTSHSWALFAIICQIFEYGTNMHLDVCLLNNMTCCKVIPDATIIYFHLQHQAMAKNGPLSTKQFEFCLFQNREPLSLNHSRPQCTQQHV